METRDTEEQESVTLQFSGTTLLAISILLSSLILTAGLFLGSEKVSQSLAGLSLAPLAKTPDPDGTPSQNPALAPPPEPTQQPSLEIAKFLDDDPRLGSNDAPVVVIEFSDFQCPFCRKFWRETLPGLEKDYIETGKVQFVYRDFPLSSLHPGAQPAAEAAECADEQGKWREMHDKIFEEQDKQGQGTVAFGTEELKKWASAIAGLDAAKFNECADSGKYREEVNKDFSDGSAAGTSGTPTFLIGKRGSAGQILVGAQPYSAFQQILDGLLG